MIRTQSEKYIAWSALFITLIVYLTGMARIGIMDIDASLYAEMARELLRSGDFFEIRNRAIENYLDKPPLIFWSAAGSYYLFGVNDFAYRLPTFVTTLLGLWSVYRFSLIYYNRGTAITAAIMLSTCQAWFLINHDVRTDTMLANFVMFATWQLAAFLETRKVTHLILGFTGIGLAMLAKGPLGLMIPVIGIGLHIILKGGWRKIFRPEWLLGPVIIILVLLPFIYSLYKQYGTYGLEFYFWTQSFGRITGENYWQDQSGPFFFVHTFAWSFLPWTMLTILALARMASQLIRVRKPQRDFPELITPLGFLMAFLALSLSSYKLPHYIYVVFPYAAIFSAAYAIRIVSGQTAAIARRTIKAFQYFISFSLPVAVVIIIIIGFPFSSPVWWAMVAAGIGVPVFFVLRFSRSRQRWFFISLASILFTNFMLNLYVYPEIIHYQADKNLASYIDAHEIDKNKLYQMDYHSSAFDFHSGSTPPQVNARKLERLAERDNIWLITFEPGLEKMTSQSIDYEIVATFEYYPVQIMTLKFINRHTRSETLRKLLLVKVYENTPDHAYSLVNDLHSSTSGNRFIFTKTIR